MQPPAPAVPTGPETPAVLDADDLLRHSLRALDWSVVCAALARCCHTIAGARAAETVPLHATLDAVQALYAAVDEVLALRNEGLQLPLGGISDIAPLVREAGRSTALARDELQELFPGIGALDRLGRWVRRQAHRCPQLALRAAPLDLDAELVHWTSRAFTRDGELSAEAWPILGELRGRITELERGIRDELDRLVRSDDLSEVLQDRFVTERAGRFVLPMRASAPRTLGIVHGTSNTGETVYMEPAQVVARANRLREARSELEREERRILAWLTALVAQHESGLIDAISAATALDLVHARAALGTELRGRIPDVGDQGVIHLRQGRHPVLALRGIPVVPNDLRLDGRARCLVLTGPNTGGKTVALKTLGLSALFVRAGIPVPCADGSRVDLFPRVIADVGDIQTVSGDLSTFSGHVLVMKSILEQADHRSLVLMDELGVGTDPAQGAPLARAVLEALLDTRARLAVTTHYAEVKALSAESEAVRLAAMQYAHGEPTYRLEEGFAGQSHAFAIARLLRMPAAIVDRARALQDAGTRQLTELMEELEERRGEVATLQARLAEQERALAHRERRLRQREQSLETRRARLQEDVAGKYAQRLREREAEVKALVAALQEDPSMDLAGRTLREVRRIREGVQAEARPPIPVLDAPAPREIREGDRVQVRSLNQVGVVEKILGKDRFAVRIGALPMKLKREELAQLDGRGQPRPAPAPRPKPPPAPKPRATAARPAGKAIDREALKGLRMDHNTADLRGQRVEEALDQMGSFLDRMSLENRDVAFILHGHGTGALKKAVRSWLRASTLIAAWRPCDPGEGGDAYTIVRLP